MAPEQLAGDVAANHRIDIYAVGLLAYELVTGVSPFTGPSPRETLAAQLTRDPKPLHEVSPEIPRTLSALIMRCLAKDPDARPQSAEEVLHELDSMTMPLGITPTQGGIDASKHGKPWMSVAAVAILLAVLAGVGYAVTRSKSPTTNVAARPVPPAAPAPAPAAQPAESLVKRAAIASGVAPEKPKPVISREDSLRIADAIRKRTEAAKLRDSVAKAKLAEDLQRKMTDSIIAANSGAAGPASTGPRRLIIAEPPDQRLWPEASILGHAVADSLRRMLRVRRGQYVIVDQDSVRLALSRTRDVTELTKSLNADLLVSIRFAVIPHDSAVLMLQAYDLTAVNAYRARTATNKTVAKNEVLTNLDVLLLSTLTYLDEMSRAPRRP